MTAPKPPLVLFHLSPAKNRRGISHYGLNPELSTGKRQQLWFFELPAFDSVYRHLVTLRGAEPYDLWIVRTLKGGQFTRRRNNVWTSLDRVPGVGLMRACEVEDLPPVRVPDCVG